MKKIIISAMLFAAGLTASVAEEGKQIGKISRINSTSGEIIVSSPSAGNNIQAGDILYLRINGKPVKLAAVYPMMSLVKCRLSPGYSSYLPSISSGLTVYKFTESVSKDIDTAVIAKSGSLNELSMLCGKSITDEKVQEYLTTITDGMISNFDDLFTNLRYASANQSYEIANANDGYYLNVRKKGISVKFDHASVLSEINLYMDGVQGFAKYTYPLPEQLSFNDTRKTVEEKIGKATKYGGQGLLPYYADYTQFNIRVNYWTVSQDDMQHKIRFITIKRT